ncbi:MAG: hypothetical protein AVO34_06260 [Firmicutes bacterium ML8_F2]|jgi:sigma-E factor negative regulatory protein RseC|nr:MAG: hypothetical protein AVO34_06260 [Firmicutes bacterium ML8_F2]
MSGTENITHPGTVTAVTPDRVFVRIMAMSACSSCHAKGMCHVADMEEKVIEVKPAGGSVYAEGDHVVVSMRRSLGTRAVLLGYIIPFVVMVATLLLVLLISGNEGLAGLSAIAVLIPYYALLYAFRNRIKNTFSFSIGPG